MAARTLPERGKLIGTSNFAASIRPVALTPKAATKGSWIIGPTGTGKTSLIKNLVVSDLEQGRGLAVIETNGDLIASYADPIPPSDQGCGAHRPDRLHARRWLQPVSRFTRSITLADQLGELFNDCGAPFGVRVLPNWLTWDCSARPTFRLNAARLAPAVPRPQLPPPGDRRSG